MINTLFKYLRPRALEAQGIPCFDAWAAVYTKKTTEFEFSVTNQVVNKERFRYFIKVPELATFYNEITDYRTAEDIGLERPKLNQTLVSINPTTAQEKFIERLQNFAKTGNINALGNLRKEPNGDANKAKMLLATNYSRQMSLDLRMLSNEYQDDPGNKASIAAKNIKIITRLICAKI